MDERTSWAADPLPDLHVPPAGFDWPAEGPDLFDVHHDQTATLYWARGTPTRLFLSEPAESDRVSDHIPMGYTTLATLEKLAIVADGQQLRVWHHSTRTVVDRGDLQQYQLVLPLEDGNYLKLGASWPFRYSLADAMRLSEVTGRPVAVCRVLSHIDWH